MQVYNEIIDDRAIECAFNELGPLACWLGQGECAR